MPPPSFPHDALASALPGPAAAGPAGPFPPTLDAARARIAAVHPGDYARTRNALGGAVSRLSPYIAHGIVTLPDVLAGVAARHRIDPQHKFVFELGWREYFHHVRAHRGDGILGSLHAGPMPDDAYARTLPADVREARTGVPVVDAAVRTLYDTGWLHNHARMWLASYVVHLRHVHWRAGADWMWAHLLDGDLASNHLSWQWVAGTASRKPYLFDAGNVARYAPPAWHSPGTVVDRSYEELEAIARGHAAAPTRASGVPGGVGTDGAARVEPPTLDAPPPALGFGSPDAAMVAGRDVWLVHPWALGEPPRDLPGGAVAVAVAPASVHRRLPWSLRRWRFVGERMAALAPSRWHAEPAAIAAALGTARSVRVLHDAHLGAELAAMLPPGARIDEPLRLFAPVERCCGSFSQWWHRALRGVRTLDDLPGIRALAGGGGAG